MKDIECPYCGADVEINHDDGYGYDENETYVQECGACGKTFAYTTTICFYYEATKAQCQNGKPHKLKPIHGCPREVFVGKARCEWCGEEVVVDAEANRKAVTEYLERLRAPSVAQEARQNNAEGTEQQLTTCRVTP